MIDALTYLDELAILRAIVALPWHAFVRADVGEVLTLVQELRSARNAGTAPTIVSHDLEMIDSLVAELKTITASEVFALLALRQRLRDRLLSQTHAHGAKLLDRARRQALAGAAS